MRKDFLAITFGHVLFLILLLGCKPQSNHVTYTGFAQGTTYTIVANHAGSSLEAAIDAVFEEIDLTFSMFNPTSLTSRINRNETDLTTPLFDHCFAVARGAWEHSGGYYDITVKPLVDAWGFGPGEEQPTPCIECIMEYVGMDKVWITDGRIVKADPRVQLDFSSVAKGLTVDRLAEMLAAAGVSDYMVEVGGEVRAKGVNAAGRAWRIGINSPVEGLHHRLHGVVVFKDPSRAIATSGNYRNWFTDEGGHLRVHTIDAKTGMPAIGNILSVSLVGEECAVADAFSTALMATGDITRAREILPPEGLEYYIIYTDERGETAVLRSPRFPLVE